MSVVVMGAGIEMLIPGTKYRVAEDLEGNKYLRLDSVFNEQTYPLRQLPKKHGRLIDADALPRYTGYALSADEVATAVENAPTIVEAEGE